MAVIEWLREQWLEIFIAFIFAIIVGYVYEKIKPKPKIEQPTMPINSIPVLARLTLPNNTEIKIKEFEKERMFGRADFDGAISRDELRFIGREHFRIIKLDDGMYIKDLDSVNGTKLNDKDIRGEEPQKLKDEDVIQVADVLKIRYVQELI